ncbi:cysteine proteinase [Macrolepiota fuliginosa MF-IS2]|uniref:Cysteine proteinase n=1 Tax=Macrolepiota fuliginosa MF-IS2 TaxID=1400762 RepID=A0A9P5XRV8_9AGAR|nr:cysteine proteinase [Macrolepiota fuliginosa MF-IS2]
MPPKRRKRGPAPNKGLAPGESLKRYLVPTQNSQHALWTWVGSEVSRAADITPEHCLMAYGLSSRNSNPLCMNKYTVSQVQPSQTPVNEKEPTTEEGDIIVISDDEGDRCTKKNCKLNPNCLNYLGQEKWENEEIAMQEFLKVATVGYNPTEDTRILELPVGLRNLGATCYANASLQVWYRNLAFRGGVYQCQLQSGADMDSPLFQLQVTFAALQEGSCKTFNPASLVESLHLRAAEQQDAQEFSKLFMSHLDVEFKKQSVPELRSLISNQFQGTQLYGTICDTCGYRSERKSDFLELEIRFESNSKLEDCIGTMLQEEKLTGDNQYRCPQCNDLRDATRYTQLSQLPPILHFSLLRFVYDFSTMERRKSKYTISFPTTLDMNQFLKDDTEATAQQQDQDINVYELAGILLHKGASAYHGHYEAQVYDTEKRSWFQFNDEVVTRIETLGDKKKVKEKAIIVDDDDDSSRCVGKRPAKKRRKVVSDDETESSQPKSPSSRSISSRDAYMLIYVRRSDQYNTDTSTPVPPQQALEFVHTLNKDYEEECKSFVQKEESIKERFALIRQQVMDVYRRWNATSVSDDCVILGQKWLQKWLTQDCMRLAQPTLTITESETNGIEEKQVEPNSEDQQPSLDDRILCSHQKLDPAKAKYMKRIKRASPSKTALSALINNIAQDIYQKMVELTGCRYEDLSSQDVCQECVLLEFNERLYNIDHPRFVKEFEVIPEVEDNSGYWISKKWLKDWRLLKPKMHKPSEEDPAPDSAEYRDDVLCEHGALALNSSTRRRISEEAMQFLKSLFPLWNPIRGVVEPCAACDALVYVSKEDKRELRRRAEEEKALLKFMYEGTPFTAEDDSFVVIPMDFFRGWLSWLNSPADHKRSEKLDNSPFFCEHGLLAFDPNCPSDMEMIVTIIRQRDWEILETLYDSGPRVGLKKAPQNDDDKLYEPEIPVCEDCRLKRRVKTEWVYTEIIVQLIHGTETSTKRKPIATYSTKNGTRQSKRLRQARENEKRRFAVTKQTTVKDIKVKIQENFKIPTICQRLFFRGQELQENEATVESLQVFTNEVLDLREENEVHEIGSDFEEGQPSKKQRRETERGFGGTVLSGEYEPERQSSCSCEDTPHGITPVPSEKTCTVCTLLNAYDAIACQVCGTIFV